MRFWCSILLLLSPLVLSAQETRGTILGRVTDPSGAVIAGADVKVTNTATGVAIQARTNEAGNFVLPYLLSGTYTVQADMAGFKRSVRDGIQVRINDTVEVNVAMQVGDAAESIQVLAETPLLETASSSLGQVVDERRVMDLPTLGGSPMVLVQLAPGTINSTDMRLSKAGSFSINKNSQFATDGAGNYNNEFTLDGSSNTQAESGSQRVGFIPPSNAIGEFKVQTSSYDASVGHTSARSST